MAWHPRLIFWLVILLAPFLLWLLASLALRGRLGELYLRHFENPRRERLFLSAVSFLIAFSAARSVAYAVHREAIVPPTARSNLRSAYAPPTLSLRTSSQ